MFKNYKSIIYSKPFLRFLYHFIHTYCMTLRFRVANETPWTNELEKGGAVILCTWHQQFFSAIHHFRTYKKYNPALMISQSRDGDLIASVANRTGWHTARGSSSNDGKTAMMAMIDHLKKFKFGGHVLDGPRGPMGIIKAGIIRMAHDSNATIVPFYVFAENAWYFNSWDHFMLPKPFSKVTLSYGDRIKFKPTTTPAEFESQRKQLEDIMRHNIVFPLAP